MDKVDLHNAVEFKEKYFSEDKTQADMVLEYMERYGSITPLEALYAFNSWRLGARIADLRKRGYNIHTELNDGDKNYAIYTIVGKE